MKIPSLILKQLYTFGSLENEADGVRFGLKNRLSDAVLTGVKEIKIEDVVNEEEEKKGPHTKLKCTECHADIKKIPHDKPVKVSSDSP